MATWAVKANWQMYAFLSCNASGARNGDSVAHNNIDSKRSVGDSPTTILPGDKGE